MLMNMLIMLAKSPLSKAQRRTICDLASMKMFIIVMTSQGRTKSGPFDPFFIQASNNLKTLRVLGGQGLRKWCYSRIFECF